MAGESEKTAERIHRRINKSIHHFIALREAVDDEFLKVLVALLYLLRQYGIDKILPNLDNEEEMTRFFGEVHQGWKLAHEIIVCQLLQLIERINECQRQKAVLHKSGTKQQKVANRRLAAQLEFRVKLLRRFYDSVVWFVTQNDLSSIRRMALPGSSGNFSRENIEYSEEYISSLNADPFSIAINADITSFIRMGDVFLSRIGEGVSLIELKEGSKNSEILKLVQDSLASGADDEKVSHLSAKDREQFQRIRSQLTREQFISDAINRGSAIDPKTGRTVSIIKVEVELQSYSELVESMCGQIDGSRTYAIDEVDGCLYLGAYSDHEFARMVFPGWMEAIGCFGDICNLLEFVRFPLVRPLPNYELSSELLEKLLRDQVLIVACLDLPKFVETANSQSPGLLKFVEIPEDLKDRSSTQELLLYRNKLVQVSRNGKSHYLGAGILDRIYFDLQTPMNALEHTVALMDRKLSDESIP